MQDIIYRFEKAEDYKIVPINNVYGNLTSTGEIFCDFVFEAPEVSEEIVYTKTKDGNLEQVSKESKEKIILISSFIGVSINKNTAKNIAYWLLKKVDELDEHE